MFEDLFEKELENKSNKKVDKILENITKNNVISERINLRGTNRLNTETPDDITIDGLDLLDPLKLVNNELYNCKIYNKESDTTTSLIYNDYKFYDSISNKYNDINLDFNDLKEGCVISGSNPKYDKDGNVISEKNVDQKIENINGKNTLCTVLDLNSVYNCFLGSSYYIDPTGKFYNFSTEYSIKNRQSSNFFIETEIWLPLKSNTQYLKHEYIELVYGKVYEYGEETDKWEERIFKWNRVEPTEYTDEDGSIKKTSSIVFVHGEEQIILSKSENNDNIYHFSYVIMDTEGNGDIFDITDGLTLRKYSRYIEKRNYNELLGIWINDGNFVTGEQSYSDEKSFNKKEFALFSFLIDEEEDYFLLDNYLTPSSFNKKAFNVYGEYNREGELLFSALISSEISEIEDSEVIIETNKNQKFEFYNRKIHTISEVITVDSESFTLENITPGTKISNGNDENGKPENYEVVSIPNPSRHFSI